MFPIKKMKFRCDLNAQGLVFGIKKGTIMKQYGVYLSNRYDHGYAGLIKIDPSGIFIIERGDEKWDIGDYKQLGKDLIRIYPDFPLDKKHNVEGKNEKLSSITQRYEARRICLDINFNGLMILGHEVTAFPVIIDDDGKMRKILYWHPEDMSISEERACAMVNWGF